MKPRWRCLWLLLLVVPLALGLARLRLDVEVLNLLPDDVPAVQGLKLYQRHFANVPELILTVSGDELEQTESAARQLAEFLRQQTNLTSRVIWQPPWLEHPDQTAELIAYLWLNQPPEALQELAGRLAETNRASVLTATRERLATSLSPIEIGRLSYDPYGFTQLPEAAGASSPLLDGHEGFASADGTFRILFVEPKSELRSYRDCAAWLSQIQQAVRQCQRTPDWPGEVQVAYTGSPAFTAEIATGMETDMRRSAMGTLVIIALLFWCAHRRWLPLMWLLALLVFILAYTMALGGFIFAQLNVVSLGFAAILLGLAADYGLILYQAARSQPQASARKSRREIAPSIIWSALTSAGAFLMLNLSGLPGLAQLGSLVALGVALSAAVMLAAYLPPLLRPPGMPPDARVASVPSALDRVLSPNRVWMLTVAVLVSAAAILWRDRPPLDHSTQPLRPRSSVAYAAAEEIQERMSDKGELLWLLISGGNESEVALRLDRIQHLLESAAGGGLIVTSSLPNALWPRPERQRANVPIAQALSAEASTLRQEALKAGFAPQSLLLTEQILATWGRVSVGTNVFLPANPMNRWMLGRIMSRGAEGWFALGLVRLASNAAVPAIEAQLPRDGVWLTSWALVGEGVLEIVKRDFARVIGPLAILLPAALWLAFRRVCEVFLSLATLLFSGLALWAIMQIAGWSWNLLNLMALPVLLGAGVDYTIHMQMALRRHNGDIAAARHTTGRALWLCGSSTVAGFGSLGWSSNAGLMSLGLVCAVGIGCTLLVSTLLLPVWWRTYNRR